MSEQNATAPKGPMGKCLAFYALTPPRPVLPPNAGWGFGTLKRALDLDYLHVGSHGDYEMTDKGRDEMECLS